MGLIQPTYAATSPISSLHLHIGLIQPFELDTSAGAIATSPRSYGIPMRLPPGSEVPALVTPEHG